MGKTQKITSYYTDAAREWRRLVKDPYHRLEFDTTLKYLKKYLPKNGLVLDAGGGPGRYTIELAKLGYKLVLMDYVQANLDYAQEQISRAKVSSHVLSIFPGTITNLSVLEDNSFDAVLCLGGPLSHVPTGELRKSAARELIRVAKGQAPVFISVMGKYGILSRFADMPEEVEMAKHYRDFWSRGEDDYWAQTAYAHFFTKEELNDLIRENGAAVITNVGLETFASAVEDKFSEMAKTNPVFYKNWLAMHNALCEEPAAVDASMHFLTIGRKS